MPAVILICGSVQCSGGAGAEPLAQVARERLRQHGVRGEVHVVKCLDLCQHGPHVSVHHVPGNVPESARAPDGGVAYDLVTPDGMARIIDEHVVGARPVTGLLHVDRPDARRGR
ncbi:MAG: (2Fe-2S) ferredoxin domain-containing protein [Myxococcota bacterium]